MLFLGRCLRPVLAMALCAGLSFASHAGSLDHGLLGRLAAAAPMLDGIVLQTALSASRCAVSAGVAMPDRLAIIIHGAEYVNETWLSRYGRIGRSHGCPAADNQVIERVVDSLKGGQLVFKYYPDKVWL